MNSTTITSHQIIYFDRNQMNRGQKKSEELVCMPHTKDGFVYKAATVLLYFCLLLASILDSYAKCVLIKHQWHGKKDQ